MEGGGGVVVYLYKLQVFYAPVLFLSIQVKIIWSKKFREINGWVNGIITQTYNINCCDIQNTRIQYTIIQYKYCYCRGTRRLIT